MTPSFIEDHISQIPALQLLIKLGYRYLTPEEALEARGGRSSNVLLESILKKQLQEINSIEFKGKEFTFSDSNINTAILAIRDLPLQDGFIAANQVFFDLITLGKSFEDVYKRQNTNWWRQGLQKIREVFFKKSKCRVERVITK